MKKSSSNAARGDTLIEVVFALAILTVVLATITSGAISFWRTSRFAGERTQAAMLANEQAESVRAYSQAVGWSEFSSKFNPSSCGTASHMSKVGDQWALVAGNVRSDQYTVALNCVGSSITPTSIDFSINITWKSVGANVQNKSNQYITITDGD